MMFFLLGFCFFFFFVIMESSLHVMVILVLVEFMVLFSFMFFMAYELSFLACLFFLLVGVCVGAYSVSLYVGLVRSKGSSYLGSFFYF